MQPIVSVKQLSKTYASGLQALKNIDLEIERGEIFALLGPNGAGKTTLIGTICGIVNPSGGKDRRRRPRHRPRLPRRSGKDRAGAAGAHHQRFRDGVGGRQFQPRPVRQAKGPGAHREGAAGAVAVGSQGQQDHDAVGRHEAARADRQGAVARAEDPVPRRADRRRRRGAPPRHVGGGAEAPRIRRDHHPDDALHRRGRRDGGPHRRDLEGRDHPGRGEGGADAQARQKTADAAAAGTACRNTRGAGGRTR